MGMVFIVMGDDNPLCFFHPESLRRALEIPNHFFPRRLLVRMVRERNMDAGPLAAFAFAGGVHNVKFHHAPCRVGCCTIIDREAKIQAPYPFDAAFLALLPIVATSLSLAKDVAHAPTDALTFGYVWDHSGVSD